jgi:hypothetical protein
MEILLYAVIEIVLQLAAMYFKSPVPVLRYAVELIHLFRLTAIASSHVPQIRVNRPVLVHWVMIEVCGNIGITERTGE